MTLTEDGGRDAKVLLFGDLAYETIMKIFDYSEYHDREEYLAWDLLLAPHHCSKKVMYVREDGQDVLKLDILEAFERHAREGSVVVASSATIPTTDLVNANPPHRKAADRYNESADRFICTMEWPSADDPSPVVLGIDQNGPGSSRTSLSNCRPRAPTSPRQAAPAGGCVRWPQPQPPQVALRGV